MKEILYGAMLGVVRFLVPISEVLPLMVAISVMPSPLSSEVVSQSKELVERQLEKMGYEEIEINDCKISFFRDLGRSCPSNKALGYRRNIDLRNLNFKEVSDIRELRSGAQIFYYFKIEAADKYLNLDKRLTYFNVELRRRFGDLDWGYYFNHNKSKASALFDELFPDVSDINTWISSTCYGDAPELEMGFSMNFDHKAEIEVFRDGLLNYSKHKSCGPK